MLCFVQFPINVVIQLCFKSVETALFNEYCLFIHAMNSVSSQADAANCFLAGSIVVGDDKCVAWLAEPVVNKNSTPSNLVDQRMNVPFVRFSAVMDAGRAFDQLIWRFLRG